MNQQKYTIPPDFDYSLYLEYNPDLTEKGINNEDLAKKHYLLFGINENRVYKKQSLVKNKIDIDFDPVFYLSEYPDVAEYYKYALYIPQEEKLFHHYLNYGKKEGRFKNKIEQEQSLIDTNHKILNFISTEELICPENELECICLLTTEKEINNGKYSNFINHLISTTKISPISKKIDFKIILNKGKHNRMIGLISLKKIFGNVEIINLNLSKKEDIYLDSIKDSETLPPYGLKSGPNHTFLKTISMHKQYNTILLLETDCLLGENWIDKLYHYTKYSNGFLISGATYDGLVFAKSGSAMLNHINGGTGLYATGNKILQNTITFLSEFLIQQISYNMPGLAYDYALKLLIDHNINHTYNNSKEREVWQFINRNYLPCKLIINCSTDTYNDIYVNNLQKKYNYSILHIK